MYLLENYLEIEKGEAQKWGRDSLQYKSVMNAIDFRKGRGSNYFFVSRAKLYLPKDKRLATLEDSSKIVSDSTWKRDFYTNFPQIVLWTCEDTNFPRNNFILKNLAEQLKERGYSYRKEYDENKPLIISDLEFVADIEDKSFCKNPYGLKLKIVDGQTRIESDERFRALNDGSLVRFGESKKRIWVRARGLSRISFDSNIKANFPDLCKSHEDGRLIIFEKERDS